MTPSAKKTPHFPRRKWTRSPVEKVHSTTKGSKGYDRKIVRRKLRSEVEDME